MLIKLLYKSHYFIFELLHVCDTLSHAQVSKKGSVVHHLWRVARPTMTAST